MLPAEPVLVVLVGIDIEGAVFFHDPAIVHRSYGGLGLAVDKVDAWSVGAGEDQASLLQLEELTVPCEF